MAVTPTLQYHQAMPGGPEYSTADTISASTHSEASVKNNTQTISMLHPHGVALPLGPLLSNENHDQNYVSFWQAHGHMPAPTDGGSTIVWYCSDCGDGPLGSWQVVCTNCAHQKCSACPVEYTK